MAQTNTILEQGEFIPTQYGYNWTGTWLMAGEGKKQVLFGYLHKGGCNDNS
jgi:hypothetical protein